MRPTALVLVLAALGFSPEPAAAVQLGTTRAAGSGAISAGPGGIGAVKLNAFNNRNTTPALTLTGIRTLNALIKPAAAPSLISGDISELSIVNIQDTNMPELPGRPRGVVPDQEIGAIAADIAPDIEGLSDLSIGLEQASGSGGKISDRLLGRHGQDGSGRSIVSPDNAIGLTAPGSALKPYTARAIPSPLGFFEHAKSIALARAQAMGYGPEKVFFGEAAAYLPGLTESSWVFTFYLIQHPAQTHVDQITVQFKNAGMARRGDEIGIADDPQIPGSLKTSYVAREYVHSAAPLPLRRIPVPLNSEYFTSGTRVNPDKAMELLRKKLTGVGRDVSFSFRMRRPDASGAQDLWYHVHDASGATFLVNGRTGEILERRRVNRNPSSVIREKSFLMEAAFKLTLGVLSLMLAGGLLWGLITSLFDS